MCTMRNKVFVFEICLPLASALCGKHCLNALFQRPQFTEVDLSNFARELDEHERIVMTENGVDTKEFLKFMSVANFSYINILGRFRKRRRRRKL